MPISCKSLPYGSTRALAASILKEISIYLRSDRHNCKWWYCNTSYIIRNQERNGRSSFSCLLWVHASMLTKFRICSRGKRVIIMNAKMKLRKKKSEKKKIKSAGVATEHCVCNNEWVAWRSLYTWGPLSCMQFVWSKCILGDKCKQQSLTKLQGTPWHGNDCKYHTDSPTKYLHSSSSSPC